MALYDQYRGKHGDLADQLLKMQRRELPAGWDKNLTPYPADPKGAAGRDVSGKILNTLAQNVPWLLGGSADLAPSTKTRLTFEGAGDFTAHDRGGRNFHFGIREHAMGAIMNGLALSKVRAYGSGFMIFSDYMRAPIRLSAIMEIPTIYIFTHDSIGVGEDGPTHQPIEQLASLRAIPGLITLRPGDANEVLEAWKLIMQLKHEPVALILSRQAMPTLDRTKFGAAPAWPRAPTSWPTRPAASPTSSCWPRVARWAVRERLGGARQGGRQGARGQHAVVGVVRAPEPGVSRQRAAALGERPRRRRAGLHLRLAPLPRLGGAAIGMKTFGASAPLKELQKRFGFTVEAVVEAAHKQLAGR
jgi:transketolase